VFVIGLSAAVAVVSTPFLLEGDFIGAYGLLAGIFAIGSVLSPSIRSLGADTD